MLQGGSTTGDCRRNGGLHPRSMAARPAITYRGAREDLRRDARRRRGCLRPVGGRLDRAQFPSWLAPLCRARGGSGDRRCVAPAGAVPSAFSSTDRPSEVARLANRLGIGIVQLHGQEPPEDLVELAIVSDRSGVSTGRAVGLDRVIEYLGRAGALGRLPDAVLIDAHVPGQSGGTGALVADDVLDSIPPLPRLILAGGLTPENVAERAARARPWMVDVASGVESVPGRKDLARVEAFIRRLVQSARAGASRSHACDVDNRAATYSLSVLRRKPFCAFWVRPCPRRFIAMDPGPRTSARRCSTIGFPT